MRHQLKGAYRPFSFLTMIAALADADGIRGRFAVPSGVTNLHIELAFLQFEGIAKSVIRRGDQSLTPADVKSGDRVGIKTSVSGDVKTAVEIIVQGGGDAEDGGHGDHGGQLITIN